MSNRKLYTSPDRKAEYWRHKRLLGRVSTASGRAAMRNLRQVFGKPITKPDEDKPQ